MEFSFKKHIVVLQGRSFTLIFSFITHSEDTNEYRSKNRKPIIRYFLVFRKITEAKELRLGGIGCFLFPIELSLTLLPQAIKAMREMR